MTRAKQYEKLQQRQRENKLLVLTADDLDTLSTHWTLFDNKLHTTQQMVHTFTRRESGGLRGGDAPDSFGADAFGVTTRRIEEWVVGEEAKCASGEAVECTRATVQATVDALEMCVQQGYQVEEDFKSASRMLEQDFRAGLLNKVEAKACLEKIKVFFLLILMNIQ